MSNFFEQELRKLFGDGEIIHDPVFAGRACVGGLDAGRQVRAEFVTMGHADHYEALRLTLLDNDLGVVDILAQMKAAGFVTESEAETVRCLAAEKYRPETVREL